VPHIALHVDWSAAIEGHDDEAAANIDGAVVIMRGMLLSANWQRRNAKHRVVYAPEGVTLVLD
jgi:hypothetical protein